MSAGYWDARRAAEAIYRDPASMPSFGLWVEPASDVFGGVWVERNRLNIPGPFYGAETDTCCAGLPAAPESVLLDDLGQEFVYRQPQDLRRLVALLSAAHKDPFAGYGWDGDQYWTVEGVRDWWADRGEVIEWIATSERRHDPTDREADLGRFALASYRAHLTTAAHGALGQYLFWLAEGRARRDDETVPLL